MRVSLCWACLSAAKLMDLGWQSRSLKRGIGKRAELLLPEALRAVSEARLATCGATGEWGLSRMRDGDVLRTGLC